MLSWTCFNGLGEFVCLVRIVWLHEMMELDGVCAPSFAPPPYDKRGKAKGIGVENGRRGLLAVYRLGERECVHDYDTGFRGMDGGGVFVR